MGPFQPSEKDQVACVRSFVCTGAGQSPTIFGTNQCSDLTPIILLEQAEKVSWVAELYMDHPGAEFLHGVLPPPLLSPNIFFFVLDHFQAQS